MSNKEGFKNFISDFKRQNIASTTKLQFERLQSVGHEQNLVKKKKKVNKKKYIYGRRYSICLYEDVYIVI